MYRKQSKLYTIVRRFFQWLNREDAKSLLLIERMKKAKNYGIDEVKFSNETEHWYHKTGQSGTLKSGLALFSLKETFDNKILDEMYHIKSFVETSYTPIKIKEIFVKNFERYCYIEITTRLGNFRRSPLGLSWKEGSMTISSFQVEMLYNIQYHKESDTYYVPWIRNVTGNNINWDKIGRTDETTQR